MMQIQEIAKGIKFEDSESVKLALERVRAVPEHELHYYLVARDTLQTTALETRQIITLAQVENDRRTTNRTRWLAISTTVLSGLVGLIGVALGAYLTSDSDAKSSVAVPPAQSTHAQALAPPDPSSSPSGSTPST